MTDAAVVSGLSFTFLGRAAPSLIDVNCRIPQATFTVVTGQTGSGKSTFLRALAGLIPHHSSGVLEGSVQLFGRDTRSTRPAELARHAGLVLQSPDEQLCATTVEAEAAFGLENLATPVEEIGPRIADCLKSMGLAGFERRATRQLSGGQKQRLLLASILAMRPRLLLLDEPLSQLDPSAAADLLGELDGLCATGMAVVLAEHRLEDVLPRADRLLVFDRGRLAEDLTLIEGDHPELASRLTKHGLEAPEMPRLAQRLGLPNHRLETFVERFGDAHPGDEHLGRKPADQQRLDGRPAGSANAASAPSSAGKPATPVLVQVERLSAGYPDHEPVWSEVSFSMAPGECVAMVGANGSGKSTLLAVLAGLLRPRAGQVRWAPAGDARPPRPSAGLLFQNPDLMLFSSTVRDELRFGAARADSIERIAAELSLLELLEDPPLALSQGQRLRVAVGAVLAQSPRLLLLDEPTTAQDRLQLAATMQSLVRGVRQGQGIEAMLFSTHDLAMMAPFADRVLVLGGGGLLADVTPEELLGRDDLLAAAGLRRPPILELRQRLGLRGLDDEAIARELEARPGDSAPG